MKGAFGTIVSAAAVAAVCYLLATASWQQVLFLFLSASLGWCVFSCLSPVRRPNGRAGHNDAARSGPPKIEAPQPTAPPVEELSPAAGPNSAHRFPIHKLARLH